MVIGKDNFGKSDNVWEDREGFPTLETGNTIIKVGKNEKPKGFEGSWDYPWSFEIRNRGVLLGRCLGFSTEEKAKEAALVIFYKIGT